MNTDVISSMLFYIKRLKQVISPDYENRYDKILRDWRQSIIANNENEDWVLIPLIDFITEFLNPLQRTIRVIYTRINEQNLEIRRYDNVESVPSNFLTIEELYKYLTDEVPLLTVRVAISNLNCSMPNRSELIESIERNDFNKFKSVLKTNQIDYSLLSNICSDLCGLSIQADRLQNEEISFLESSENETQSENGSIRDVCFLLDFQKQAFLNQLENNNQSEEDIEEANESFSEVYENIKDLYKQNKILQAMGTECVFYFICCVQSLIYFSEEKMLTSYEQFIIRDFIKEKDETLPIVHKFLSIYTKGKPLNSEFELSFDSDAIDPTEDAFIKMIEQCYIIEKSTSSLLQESPNEIVSDKEKGLEASIFDVPSNEGQQCQIDSDDVNKLLYKYLHNLPNEELAINIFSRAIEKGYIKRKSNHFKWMLLTKALLEYLCGRIFCDDYISNGKWTSKGGDLPRKTLSMMFGEKNLGNYRIKIIHTGTLNPPKSHEIIDELFDLGKA